MIRYRVVGYDRGGEIRLKGRVRVDTLCRGEVAEWLNAAVSKTVTSAIPASGVRIPPSPHFSSPPYQLVSTLRLRLRLSARRRLRQEPSQHFSFRLPKPWLKC